MPPLNEAQLSELEILDPTDPENMTVYVDANGDKKKAALNAGIDWNGNGVPGEVGLPPINIDTVGANGRPKACRNTDIKNSLEGHDDWNNISIGFRQDGDSADGAVNATVEPEPTTEDLLALVEELGVVWSHSPAISEVPDLTIQANTPTSGVPIEIYDVETEASELILTVTSNNETLIPSQNVVLEGTGVQRSITISPAVDQLGVANVTLTATDTSGLSTARTFEVNVVPAIVLLGDLNRDNVVDDKDIDLLFTELNNGNSKAEYDLNSDSVVDEKDVEFLVRNILGTEFGDVNLDGRINNIDFGFVLGGFDQIGLGWLGGDVNGDGKTDNGDFGMVLGDFGFET